MDVLEEAMREMIKEVGFSRILDILLEYSGPTSSEEAADMSKTLLFGLAACISWEGVQHILDHKGYDCATGIIDVMCDRLREECTKSLSVVLELRGLEQVPDDHNTTVFKEILAEMEKRDEKITKKNVEVAGRRAKRKHN